MKERIALLNALMEQQQQLLQTIAGMEAQIETLGGQIHALNNAQELSVSVLANGKQQSDLLVRARWTDQTAEHGDEIRKVVRTILSAKLEAAQERLRRAVENEESRLASLLKASNGNTELPTSDSEVQDQGTEES